MKKSYRGFSFRFSDFMPIIHQKSKQTKKSKVLWYWNLFLIQILSNCSPLKLSNLFTLQAIFIPKKASVQRQNVLSTFIWARHAKMTPGPLLPKPLIINPVISRCGNPKMLSNYSLQDMLLPSHTTYSIFLKKVL